MSQEKKPNTCSYCHCRDCPYYEVIAPCHNDKCDCQPMSEWIKASMFALEPSQEWLEFYQDEFGESFGMFDKE